MDRRCAWEAFQSGGDPGDVGPGLLDSWRRSRWSGVDPSDTDIPQVTVDADTPFVRVAAPVMLGLADQLAGTSSCLALADPRGTVVWRWVSDPGIAGDLDDVGVVRGGRFAEEAIGTNGIGTALESGGPAFVRGADHWVEAFHRWACVAAPVVHPVTRKVCGAVNITCRAGDAGRLLGLAASAMVQGVSEALRAGAATSERRLLDAFLTARARTTAPVVALDAMILLAADSTGGVGLDHAELWALVTEAGPDEEIDVADGLGAHVWPVTPGTTADGVVLTLRPDPAAVAPVGARDPRAGLGLLEHAEAEVVAGVLAECGGNKAAAAARLGISRGTLYAKLRRYRLTAAPTRGAHRPV
ncbi:helix-turn-helix domain-containing protein [Pseudonocardia sp. N23]|uniref:helix-turn-helix domain-containing protein n=1 Tax=Pseudonocardia sp. N23 TaxID=1987376 RepID=UPI000BFE496A|nr:helix-turn-helix domain-containing protein [Pseudonocardia sp. N23]